MKGKGLAYNMCRNLMIMISLSLSLLIVARPIACVGLNRPCLLLLPLELLLQLLPPFLLLLKLRLVFSAYIVIIITVNKC